MPPIDFVISPKSKRLVVELINKEIQRLAMDANLYELFRVDTSYGRRAAARRRELKAVLKELQEQEIA